MARAQLARHDDFKVHVLMPDRAPFRRRHPTALHHAPVAMLRAGGHLELGLARESRYDNLDENNSISGIWEKWGRHIWGKGVHLDRLAKGGELALDGGELRGRERRGARSELWGIGGEPAPGA